MSAPENDPRGSLQTALAHTARLLHHDPAMAETQAREVLRVMPGQIDATLLLGMALRKKGDATGAVAVLEPLARQLPKAAPAQLELGFSYGAAGMAKPAIAAVARGVALDARLGSVWRDLGDNLMLAGEAEAADEAYLRHVQSSSKDPRILEAGAALYENRLNVAERLLKEILAGAPTDVVAMRMLGELGMRVGRNEEALELFARAIELAPGFTAARHNYASALYRSNRPAEAVTQVDLLLEKDPKNPGFRNLKAAALGRLGEFDAAIAIYETALKEFPRQSKGWMSFGHALKTVGRQADSIDAYREAVRQQPGLGEAWWSLANLKTVKFTPEDVAVMRERLEDAALSEEDRFHLHFALGKALEDAGDYEDSFRHYAAGNASRRKGVTYDADETTDQLRRARALFTPDFFAAREGWGCPARDPIFVVGLPRAGSTLVEQILASHSMVEGTMELPDMLTIARRIGGRKRRSDPTHYPEALADFGPDEVRALGEEYLERTRIQRKTSKPIFIDKMPNNFAHAGLIRLILPNARIVDARRHPLGCCFSGFKQHFARGQSFTYDLAEIGRYYHDYVALMAHLDAVQPGAVHRVIYERMVDDTESEIRRLLDYCGLPFEDACLNFHETDRAVRTASSEQVRQPIFKDGVDQWRHFEPWLAPLKETLGPVLAAYPAVPDAFTA